MNIVLDANIFIAALMGSRSHIVIITSYHHKFYAPRKIIEEIKKHKEYICERSGYTSEEFDAAFNALVVFVKLMERSEYNAFFKQAKHALEKRDLKDADYVACAQVVHADFIWTNDKDFSVQNLVKTKTTQRSTNIAL